MISVHMPEASAPSFAETDAYERECSALIRVCSSVNTAAMTEAQSLARLYHLPNDVWPALIRMECLLSKACWHMHCIAAMPTSSSVAN